MKKSAAIYVEECCDLCLCFPPGVFIVSSLALRSLIHFEFIFVYGVRECNEGDLLCFQ